MLQCAMSPPGRRIQGSSARVTSKKKRPTREESSAFFFQKVAVPTGLEPAISTLTGWHVRPTTPRDRAHEFTTVTGTNVNDRKPPRDLDRKRSHDLPVTRTGMYT